MPWRLIIFIVVCAIFVAFITFNLENRCDIGFGITTIPQVPVFVTIFVSFVIGLLCALPLSLHIKKKPLKEKKPKAEPPAEIEEVDTIGNIKKDAAEARKRFFSRRGGG